MLSGGTLSASATAGTAVFRMVVSSDSMKNPTATNQGRRRLAVSVRVLSRACKAIDRESSGRQGRVHDALRLGEQPVQMGRIVKTLGVDFVDIFGSRRSRGEPSATRGDLHAAQGRVVAGRTRQ